MICVTISQGNCIRRSAFHTVRWRRNCEKLIQYPLRAIAPPNLLGGRAPRLPHGGLGAGTRTSVQRRRGDLFSLSLPQDAAPLILLDLNMPGMGGRRTLQTIKEDKQFQSIPVIVLATSNHESNIKACYSLGANTYIQKPVDFLRDRD